MMLVLSGCEYSVIQGEYQHYDNMKSIVEGSDLVITGRVNSMKTSQEIVVGVSNGAAYLYTIAEVEIIEVFRGDVEVGSTIQVKQVEDEQTNIDAGYLAENETSILFLKVYETVPASMINPYQGRIPVVDGYAILNPKNDIPELLNASTQSKEDDIQRLAYDDAVRAIKESMIEKK